MRFMPPLFYILSPYAITSIAHTHAGLYAFICFETRDALLYSNSFESSAYAYQVFLYK